MSTKNTDVMAAIVRLGSDPSGIIDINMQMLRDNLNGDVDIVDATNPFAFLVESTAVIAAGAMGYTESKTRQMYKSLCQNYDDLYNHMSDVDYYGRFSLPGQTTYTVILLKNEILNNAVSSGNIKKLTIPTQTVFSVSGYSFGMHYPIDIKIMPHGGLQVVYNNSNPSPTHPLTSNLVEFEEIQVQNNAAIKLTIPVEQFEMSNNYTPINASTGFSEDYAFPDLFINARVYHKNDLDNWVECKTTHSEQVHDATVPTVTLKVFENALRVTIPQIYISSGMLTNELRVDIYTTLGNVPLLLGGYELSEFNVRWLDLDKEDGGIYVKPLANLTAIAAYSQERVIGGMNGISFTDMRERVIMNSTSKPTPISDEDLKATLSDKGYDVLLHKDNITDRVYVATKTLPAPIDGSNISGIGCTILPWHFKMSNLLDNTNVHSNGDQITLKPNTLLREFNGRVDILPVSDIDAIAGLSQSSLVRYLNTEKLLYNPFHTVYNSKDDIFTARSYYLDSPEILQRYFEEENISAGIQLSTNTVRVSKTSNGFELVLTTVATESSKLIPDNNLRLQLSVMPINSDSRVYVKGILIANRDGARTWAFRLDSNICITDKHAIGITSLDYYEGDLTTHFVNLIQDFDLLHIVTDLDIPNVERGNLDLLMCGDYLSDTAIVITRERLRIKFGCYLDGLYSKTRSYASECEYLLHDTDVYARYMVDMYKEEDGVLCFDSEGELILTHAKGDIIVIDGEKLISNKAGTVVSDAGGSPVLVGTRDTTRVVDTLLLEAKYLFIGNDAGITYRNDIPRVIVSYLEDDVNTVAKNLLELTSLFLYLKKTYGAHDVRTTGSEIISMDTAQSFTVDIYVDTVSYQNSDLRDAVTTIVKSVIGEQIKNNTVATSKLTVAIREKIGDDAISLFVHGFGEDNKIETYTTLEDTSHTTVKKIVEAGVDGKLSLVDDISVNFIQHTT